MKRALRVTSLSDKSDMDVRFDTFERLNTGGIALSSQEIRACVYQGALSDFLSEAAQSRGLTNLIKLQKGHKDDGTLEEFVLKLFAYSNNRHEFDGQVTVFLNSFARDNQAMASVATMRSEFESVVRKFSKIQKGPILKENYSVTPLNLAEGVLIAALELSRQKKKLDPKPGWLKDRKLLDFSTGGTNTKKSLFGRIDRARELLLGGVPEN